MDKPSLSYAIEEVVTDAVKNYDGSYNSEDLFKELLSMGELVDRLSIVNFKLFTLKDKVMETEDAEFRAWASEEDVKLVMERSRLKRAIDEKLIYTVSKIDNGEDIAFIPEVKRYGNDNKS